MNRLYSRAGAFALTSALCLVTVGRLSAQATAEAPAAAAVNPAPVRPATKPLDEETIVLSPFIVEASEDADSYSAKSTLAGTRVRTELKDVGSAIQVVTAKFLQDTGARNSQDLLVYTTSTEVGGSSGNFVGAGNGAMLDTRGQRTSPQTNTRVRGLASADNTRDFFLTDIPWDSYNVGRVDLQRGPNSILFGIGSPAGIVNSSLNVASFKDSNTVEFRFDNNSSHRESADFNKVLMKDELAVRLTLLDDNTKYQQKPAFNHDKRVFGAFRYDPKFLNKNGNSISLRANYEGGEVTANRVRVTPPVDAITPWWTSMNKRTFDDKKINDQTPGSIAENTSNGALGKYLPDNVTLNPNYSPYLGAYGGQIFDQPTAMFDNPLSGKLAALAVPGGGTPTGYFMPSLNTTGPSSVARPTNFTSGPWQVYKGISNYSDYAIQAQLPNYLLGVYKAKTVADPNIFDYNNLLIDGPNKQELQKFHAFDTALTQTFLDNKLGLEIAYDYQKYSEENDNLITNPYLTVEVANRLPDGRSNPNVGRAMVIGAPNSNGGRDTMRQAWRATGYGELDFKQFMGNTTLASIFGVHRFTGLWSTQQSDQFGQSWYSYVTDTASWRPWQDVGLDSRRIPSVSYLSQDLVGFSSPNQAHIQNIKAVQVPYGANIYKFNPNNKAGVVQGTEQFADLIGWESVPFRVLDGYHAGNERNMLTRSDSLNKSRDTIDSQAFVWQGFFWDGTLVPTVGWRKDIDRNYNAGNAPSNGLDNSWNYTDKTWTIPTGLNDPRVGKNNVSFNRDSGESLSWSFVLHTPKELKKHMPWGTDISLFFNHSDNFQPAGGRRDVFGSSLPSPTGKTKDYGVTITTLDDKLILKINWYQTDLTNASLDGGGTGALSSVYRVSSNEAWGWMFAQWARLHNPGGTFNGSTNYAHVNGDPSLPLIDPTIPFLEYQPQPGETVAHALAAENLAINTFIDPANKPPASFLNFWTINRDTWDPTTGWAAGGVNFSVPSSLAVTGDTSSKGTEYELTAQPIPNWNISVNAAKTSAQRLNLAGSFAGWVDNRNIFYQGPAGDVRMWNGSVSGTQTVKQVWNTEFYASYLLYRLQEHADVPELRPWRFNVVTNYTFRDGRLKNFNVGGGYRWQDGIVVGYPIVNGFFDLNHPYMGPKETTIDLWAGYERKLNRRLTWRIQLNARNVFGSNKLIPVTVEPDGSPGSSRIAEPKVYTLTNTLKF